MIKLGGKKNIFWFLTFIKLFSHCDALNLSLFETFWTWFHSERVNPFPVTSHTKPTSSKEVSQRRLPVENGSQVESEASFFTSSDSRAIDSTLSGLSRSSCSSDWLRSWSFSIWFARLAVRHEETRKQRVRNNVWKRKVNNWRSGVVISVNRGNLGSVTVDHRLNKSPITTTWEGEIKHLRKQKHISPAAPPNKITTVSARDLQQMWVFFTIWSGDNTF